MEMEAHHGHEHHADPNDSFGKIIGIQTALLAMFLSIFTILAHQTTTEAIILVNDSSNQWSHYQAKRIREYQVGLNEELLKLMAPNSAEVAKTITSYDQQQSKYKKELEDIKSDADKTEQEGKLVHHKTGFFELAEALLEISMILSSLYFLSHKKLFPILGLLLGVSGGIIGILGLMLHP